MKCPKCGYLGFESVERCRNCGYEFLLAVAAPTPELPLRAGARPDPDDDLALVRSGATVESPTPELPLFGPPIPDDDRPLITQPSPPRQPLSVRRATPEIPRVRSQPARAASLDLTFDGESAPMPEPMIRHARPMEATVAARAGAPEDAPVAARFVAVTIDLLILAAIDALVIYLTLQICGISLDDVAILPKGPLIAFLLVQNGGYLVAFTAGGQTLGKMAAGIRVVSSDDATMDVGRALVRTLAWFALAVPAGLGFLSALLSRDHRGLHDRFAGTRVVR